MASFDSLLSSFQEATGTPSNQNNTNNSSNKKDNSNGESQPKSMGECLDRLYRISQIRKGTATTPSAAAQQGQKEEVVEVHLAICAVIVDELTHEHVWRRWMDTADNMDEKEEKEENQEKKSSRSHGKVKASAELYVHAKHVDRIQSSWVRSKTLSKSYQPNWNDVRIIRAMLLLIEHALSDKRTTHIAFCTESCIPITTLQRAAEELVLIGSEAKEIKVQTGRSFLHAYNAESPECTRFDERACWSKLLAQNMPSPAIYKALPGWCLLSSTHASEILHLSETHLQNQPLWPCFDQVWAPEEVYFATCLALLGKLPSDKVVMRALTHSKWPKHKDEVGGDATKLAHPLEYNGVRGVWCDKGVVHELAPRRGVYGEGGCLFLRKVKRAVEVLVWEEAVLCHQGSQSSGVAAAAAASSSALARGGDRARRYHDDEPHRQSYHKREGYHRDHGHYGRRRDGNDEYHGSKRSRRFDYDGGDGRREGRHRGGHYGGRRDKYR